MNPDDLAILLGDGEPRTSLCALADTLSELAAHVFSVASSQHDDAGNFLLEASMAAAGAYPLGSAESARLSFIVAEIVALARTGAPS